MNIWRAGLSFVVMFVLVAPGVQAKYRHRHQGQQQSGKPGAFDYYLLSLSWSPEFCYEHPGSAECLNGHHGFIVHGLWPEFANGYPEDCSHAPGPSDPLGMIDIMPDPKLIQHEWETHGTCSGLNADDYFKLIRQAFTSIKIPAQFSNPKQTFSMAPSQVKQMFLQANDGLKSENIAVSCGNNYLTAVSVCLTRDLRPKACGAVRDCRANTIRIPPVR